MRAHVVTATVRAPPVVPAATVTTSHQEPARNRLESSESDPVDSCVDAGVRTGVLSTRLNVGLCRCAEWLGCPRQAPYRGLPTPAGRMPKLYGSRIVGHDTRVARISDLVTPARGGVTHPRARAQPAADRARAHARGTLWIRRPAFRPGCNNDVAARGGGVAHHLRVFLLWVMSGN